MKKTARLTLGIMAIAILLVAGCDTLDGTNTGTRHHSTNLYAYLYSGQKEHVDTPMVPILSLPLRVGVAFVPADNPSHQNYFGYSTDDIVLSESEKIALMKKISSEFKKYPFVKSIDVVPTAYLMPRGGFANLDQIRTMYDVDVMVLLSYDQVQFTGEGVLSLTYWTIVGAYVIPGERNETKTMLDAAVFDIASRKLLFRAPGIGDIKDSATPIALGEELRKNSQSGFDMAATNLTANLQVALADFKERVTNSLAQAKEMGTNAPAEYQIVYKPGYAGGGAFDGMEITLLGAAGVCFLWILRKSRNQKA